MPKRTSRGYAWGRRILLAATLATLAALTSAGPASAAEAHKYMW
jgi:hypothetical protein